MRTARPLYPSGVKIATAGSLVWLLLLGGAFLDRFHLSTFELLLLLAPWVAVPLALSLVPATSSSRFSRMSESIVRYLLLPGALLATLSFFLSVGWPAGALVCASLIVGVALALHGLERLIRNGVRSFPEFCFALGEGYALVGALWLLASRLGLQPIGFHEPIVLLTAIHFHYAGLMAAVLAGLVVSDPGAIRSPLALRMALSCAVLGPGLLGIAFLAGSKLKLAAVALMVVGECGIAVGTFRIGLSDAARTGGRLRLVGSTSVIFGMVLAGIWAVGEYLLHAFVNLEQMARYHGVLNSVGFGLCSLVGWTLLRRQTQPKSGRT
jgi:YndJ-like protein